MSNVKTSPKDFFMHLLSAITLYMVAISFTTLLFQYVNHFFPDVLAGSYAQESINSALRFAISMTLVALPVYAWTILHLRKMYKKEPEKKELWIRRWLMYFTIFVTAIIIIIDFITLINKYLGGELTSRFFLKVLAVLFVAIVVFSFYLFDIKDKMTKKIFMLYGINTVAIVLGFVIGAFFLLGSPAEQRRLRLDNERVSNLQDIYYNIQSYYINNDTLPTALTDLQNSPNYFANLTDPETGEIFEYTVSSESSYELCAVFNTENILLESSPERPRVTKAGMQSEPTFWKHGKGRTCFDLTVQKKDTTKPGEILSF